MLVPFSYNLRSLLVRRASTLLTVLGIGAVVAAVSGVLALQQGFATLHNENGRADIAVFLRPGATSEGLSGFDRVGASTLIKTLPEIATGPDGQPQASLECFLAVRRNKLGGGETNVPIRGVQPATFALRGDDFRIVEGRAFTPGTDEVVVGRRLIDRIADCGVDEVIRFNVTPFRVVGVFECAGPFESEIWGDLDRMLEALQLFGPNRVIARLAPGTDVKELSARLEEHKQTPAKVQTELEYLASQTAQISVVLIALSVILGLIMGVAAVFTATNTMLSAIAARTREVGILLAAGFRPVPIFLSFLFESILLCALGGIAGCLMTLPLNGIRTGTTNWATFTEVAFAFRVTPPVLVTAVVFATLLGLLGGAWPAFRAARMTPVQALRRH